MSDLYVIVLCNFFFFKKYCQRSQLALGLSFSAGFSRGGTTCFYSENVAIWDTQIIHVYGMKDTHKGCRSAVLKLSRALCAGRGRTRAEIWAARDGRKSLLFSSALSSPTGSSMTLIQVFFFYFFFFFYCYNPPHPLPPFPRS